MVGNIMELVDSVSALIVAVVKGLGWSYEQLITVLALSIVGMALLVLIKYKN